MFRSRQYDVRRCSFHSIQGIRFNSRSVALGCKPSRHLDGRVVLQYSICLAARIACDPDNSGRINIHHNEYLYRGATRGSRPEMLRSQRLDGITKARTLVIETLATRRRCYTYGLKVPNVSIHSRSSIAQEVRRLQSSGKKVVFTNGCFDLLHPGHLDLLTRARALGDVLVVAINSDNSVHRLKGPQRPVFPENERGEILSALEMVDYVCTFDEDTPLEAILEIRPDILVKGCRLGRQHRRQQGSRRVGEERLSHSR